MTGCCVPNCPSNSSKMRVNLFCMPSNHEMFVKWQNRIKRGDRMLKKSDRVCSLHFQDEFILKTFDTLMPDGTVHSIKRDKYSLKKGAIPTLFPNSPAYMTSRIHFRKSPKIRSNTQPRKERTVTNRNDKLSTPLSNSVIHEHHEVMIKQENEITDHEEVEIKQENEITNNQEVEDDQDRITDTSDIINSVTNEYTDWIHCITRTSEVIFFFCTTNFKPVKRIIISPPDYEVKVFVGDLPVVVSGLQYIRKKSDVKDLLRFVQEIKISHQFLNID